MAQSLYQFVIDDDSPKISYFPFVNLEPSTNLTAGWQLLYTGSGAATGPGQVGVGTSYHYTSRNGTSLLINWNGTGIQLVGSVANASYNITLDGISPPYFPDLANNILASFDSLNNTNHSLLLTTIITNATSPNVFLSFDKAVVTYTSPAGIDNTTATSQVIADSDIAFTGLWSYSAGNSMHVSNTVGNSAEATFSGSAITIYGLTSSYSGNFTVTLDNTTTHLSARSSYNNSDALLFYATDLPEDGLHHVTVTNQENRTLSLRVGGLNFTSFANSTPSRRTSTISSNSVSIPPGTIAAIVLAIVLFLVIAGIILYFACFDDDVERIPSLSPASGEEVESRSLSTTKGYGFGLGLRRGFSFAYRKSKMGSKVGSNSSEMSPNGIVPHTEYPMTPHPRACARIRKARSGMELSPARTPPSFKYHRVYKETHGILLPEIRVEQTGLVYDYDEDDADVKTLASCQDEALAATLSLSPRTSEARAAFGDRAASKLDVDTRDGARQPYKTQQRGFLQVRETSPFRVDVSTIFGMRRSNSSSGRTSGSGSSTWSKVRARLYRKAHHDDGKQSDTERRETSSCPGPESIPVLMHESGVANRRSERVPGSGTYSFLDFTSSHVSLRRQSKTTTLSSTPAEIGHGAKETSAWSENTSIRMVRIERSRDNVLAPKPDAPSTVSGGSQPSDGSGTRTQPSAAGYADSTILTFPNPIMIPPDDNNTWLSPHLAPPELAISPAATSPTESVPFSVSEIHFRHSHSDYAGIDSRRASDVSVLFPHPPLPLLGGSQANTPTYSPPPPYIVQRVLGLPMSPLSPLSPTSLATLPRISLDSPSSSGSPTARRPGTGASPTQPPTAFRVSSLLGPRPQPSAAGSVRGSAAPQLPMQGGRGSLRGPALIRRGREPMQ
ncbi:hypothetical protein JVU11DRAFT_2875 [Chiua virens]|nr:hypothetical protein JVU11DRAFT_2875 [Chiua virens]